MRVIATKYEYIDSDGDLRTGQSFKIVSKNGQDVTNLPEAASLKNQALSYIHTSLKRRDFPDNTDITHDVLRSFVGLTPEEETQFHRDETFKSQMEKYGSEELDYIPNDKELQSKQPSYAKPQTPSSVTPKINTPHYEPTSTNIQQKYTALSQFNRTALSHALTSSQQKLLNSIAQGNAPSVAEQPELDAIMAQIRKRYN
jgi:hypothetical protein